MNNERTELKGYSYADGTHWYMGDKEIAIIDPVTSEIEWAVRKSSLTNDVIEAVRSKKPTHIGKWLVEARRIEQSATQGYILVQIDGKPIAEFADKLTLGDDGYYHSQYSDEELGRLVNSAFWHPLDHVYHDSDRAKRAFYAGAECECKAWPELHIDTPIGNLHVYKSFDPDHPGVYIDLQKEGIPYNAPLVSLEFTHTEHPECQDPDVARNGILVCRIWGDVDKENFSSKVIFSGIDEFFA